VSDTERTMGLLKDQHNGLQQVSSREIAPRSRRDRAEIRMLKDRLYLGCISHRALQCE